MFPLTTPSTRSANPPTCAQRSGVEPDILREADWRQSGTAAVAGQSSRGWVRSARNPQVGQGLGRPFRTSTGLTWCVCTPQFMSDAAKEGPRGTTWSVLSLTVDRRSGLGRSPMGRTGGVRHPTPHQRARHPDRSSCTPRHVVVLAPLSALLGECSQWSHASPPPRRARSRRRPTPQQQLPPRTKDWAPTHHVVPRHRGDRFSIPNTSAKTASPPPARGNRGPPPPRGSSQNEGPSNEDRDWWRAWTSWAEGGLWEAGREHWRGRWQRSMLFHPLENMNDPHFIR